MTRPPAPPVDDVALLIAGRRSPDAFCRFYERHAPALWNWLRLQTGDRAVADDITAETFARAYAALHRFRGTAEREAVGWLYGIAANIVRDWIRRRRVESSWRERLGMAVERQHDDHPDGAVESRLDAASLRLDLLRALAALPADQRNAVILRVLEGRPYADIAAALSITQAGARQRVSRALRSLRGHLKEVSP